MSATCRESVFVALHAALIAGGALVALGCSSLGGEGGGGANLPNRGISPWEVVQTVEEDTETPLVILAEEEATLREPSLVAQGELLVIYLERQVEVEGSLEGSILRAESDDGGLSWTQPETVLTAEQVPFASRRVGAPSVTREGDRWLMAFAVDEGAAIGWAESVDGETFTEPVEVVTASEGKSVDSPSATALGRERRVYYAAAQTSDEGERRVALEAISFEDPAQIDDLGEVFAPGVDCTSTSGTPARCWDAEGVDTPEVRVATSATNRRVYRLFYTGRRGTSVGVGFAASPDGKAFSRFPFNPVLPNAVEPTNVLSRERYLLVSLGARGGVHLAINDRGQPSERF